MQEILHISFTFKFSLTDLKIREIFNSLRIKSGIKISLHVAILNILNEVSVNIKKKYFYYIMDLFLTNTYPLL